jgi:arginase
MESTQRRFENRLIDAPVRLIQVPMSLGAANPGVGEGAGALASSLREHLERRSQQVILDRFVGEVMIPAPALAEGEVRIAPGGALHVEPIAVVNRALAEAVRVAVAQGELALTLGGDHSVAIGSIAGAAATCRRLAVIWIDAHADLNWPAVSPSGRIHGMGLAASLGRGPVELTSIQPAQTPLRPEDLYLLGVRNLDPAERAWLRQGVINYATMPAIEDLGLPTAILQIAEFIQASDVDAVHVSFDLDALDPLWMPGTGSREWGGFTYREATRLLTLLRAADLPIRSLDWVELNPRLDPTGNSTAVATALLATALGEDPICG